MTVQTAWSCKRHTCKNFKYYTGGQKVS